MVASRVTILTLSVACARPVPPSPASVQLVEPHSSSGPTYGAVASVTGVVRVSSEQGAKARPVYLSTATGGSLLIAYHPTEEHLKMNGCEVQVRGRPYQPDPISAHILADHFDVMELEALGACGR